MDSEPSNEKDVQTSNAGKSKNPFHWVPDQPRWDAEMLVFEKRGQRFITLYLCTIYALYYIDSTYHSYTIYTNAVYSSINKHALVQKPWTENLKYKAVYIIEICP